VLDVGRRELLMRKYGLIAAAVVVGAGFGWIASMNARVAPPMIMSGRTIEPMNMMAGSTNLPTEHFVDYSLIYPYDGNGEIAPEGLAALR
jgi:hypothetical protein